MSTQPQLSPLEQLGQDVANPQSQTTPSSASNLSPLEQLGQDVQKQQQPQLTPAQVAYRKATAAGPNTVPGAAEKAMGAVWGDNAAQAKQGLKSTANAVLDTASGVAGASGIGALGETTTEAVPQVVKMAGQVSKWAKENPLSAIALSKIANELGVHPFDLMHKAAKYGKGLIGDSKE
jgi:hypothetical protein